MGPRGRLDGPFELDAADLGLVRRAVLGERPDRIRAPLLIELPELHVEQHLVLPVGRRFELRQVDRLPAAPRRVRPILAFQ